MAEVRPVLLNPDFLALGHLQSVKSEATVKEKALKHVMMAIQQVMMDEVVYVQLSLDILEQMLFQTFVLLSEAMVSWTLVKLETMAIL